MKEIHGLLATRDHDNVIAWAVAKGHIQSMALTQMWGSVLVSMIPLTSEALAITCRLGHHL